MPRYPIAFVIAEGARLIVPPRGPSRGRTPKKGATRRWNLGRNSSKIGRMGRIRFEQGPWPCSFVIAMVLWRWCYGDGVMAMVLWRGVEGLIVARPPPAESIGGYSAATAR